MTVRSLLYSTSQELKVVLVSYVKLYNASIELKFNTHNIKNADYILDCDVRDWHIEGNTSLSILTGDDILEKLLGRKY